MTQAGGEAAGCELACGERGEKAEKEALKSIRMWRSAPNPLQAGGLHDQVAVCSPPGCTAVPEQSHVKTQLLAAVGDIPVRRPTP